MRQATNTVAALTVGLLPLEAMAQAETVGYIDYIPVTPTSVPTLSEWGLVTLAIALAVGSYVVLRKGDTGKHLASVVAMGMGLLIAGSGLMVIRDAHANGFPSVYLSQPTGGRADIVDTGNKHVVNNSGVALRITTLLPANVDVNFVDPDLLPRCTTETTLQPYEECVVKLVLIK